jgi:hypothetical protein
MTSLLKASSGRSLAKKSSGQDLPPINTRELKLGLKTCLHAPTRSEELCSLRDGPGDITHEIDLVDIADDAGACPLKLVISGCPSDAEIDPEVEALLRHAVSDWLRADPMTREGIESMIDDLVAEVICPVFTVPEPNKPSLEATSCLTASSRETPPAVRGRRVPKLHTP